VYVILCTETISVTTLLQIKLASVESMNSIEGSSSEKLDKPTSIIEKGNMLHGKNKLSTRNSLLSFPPLNMIEIKVTPDSILAKEREMLAIPSQISNFKDGRKRSPVKDRAIDIPIPSLPFKLMPRNFTSSIKGSYPASKVRCRKRTARSISSGSSGPGTEPQTTDETNPTLPICSPVTYEKNILTLDGLSIYSPTTRWQPNNEIGSALKTLNQSVQRLHASSFSPYRSPIKRIQGNIGPDQKNLAMKTPCSSIKSSPSPRHVPVTVLSSSSSVGGYSPLKLPLSMRGRPLCDSVSKILHPLSSHEEVEGFVPSTSKTPPISMINLIPTRERIFSDSERNSEVFDTLKKYDTVPFTPKADVGASFLSTKSPKPLPKINLTPRTPLTAPAPVTQSAAHHIFPISNDNRFSLGMGNKKIDEMGLFMDGILDDCNGHKTNSTGDISDEPNEFPRLSFSPDSSHTLVNEIPMMYPVQDPKLCNASTPDARRKETFQYINEGINTGTSSINTNPITMTPRRSNFLEAMHMETFWGVDQTDIGSLSDSDDEFILTNPATIEIEKAAVTCSSLIHDSSRRVKQRRQLKSDEISENVFMSVNETSTINDIVQKNSQPLQTSSTTRPMKPFPGLAVTRNSTVSGTIPDLKDDTNKSSNSFARYQKAARSIISSEIKSSACNPDRDLVTPPATLQDFLSPPPMMRNPFELEQAKVH